MAAILARQARCNCGRTVPSDRGLAFFESCAAGSAVATDTCAICAYHRVAHDPTTPHMAQVERNGRTRLENLMAQLGPHDFAGQGELEYDRYYCGHAGWD
jgi:hypothetical protein